MSSSSSTKHARWTHLIVIPLLSVSLLAAMVMTLNADANASDQFFLEGAAPENDNLSQAAGAVDATFGLALLNTAAVSNANLYLSLFGPWVAADYDETRSIAWGDMDGDGDLDLAAGNIKGNFAVALPNKVYLNVGGVLQPTAVWVSDDHDETRSVAWGDIDGDGDLDLAAGNYGGANKVYLNENGLLGATAAWSSDDSDNTWSIAWGDMDGDGDLDLAAGNTTGANKVYLNENGVLQGTAGWVSQDINSTTSVVWGDVDEDGDLDLAAGNNGVANQVYTNNGGLLETTASWLSNDNDYTHSVAWGDMDGDGDLDLAVGNDSSENKVYLNIDGTLQSDPFWVAADVHPTRGVAWGDVDGDGDLDLAAGNNSAANTLYLNEGGVLQTAVVWSSADNNGTVSVSWGDMDGDGDLDLAAGNWNFGNKVYYNQTAPLQTEAGWVSNDEATSNSIAWGDVDGDGDLDLAAGNLGAENLYLNENGTLSSTATWTSDHLDNTQSLAWGDVDGDGDLDLATGNWGASNRLYLNVEGVLQTTSSWASADSDRTHSITWGDIDSDGDVDLVVGNVGVWNGSQYVNGFNKIYFNENGTLQTTAGWVSNESEYSYQISLGDMDGDGDLDLAVGNLKVWDGGKYVDGNNQIYLNDGGVLPETATWVLEDNDFTSSIAWGDVDGDGDLDLAIGNWGENKLLLNENGVLQTVADNPWGSGDSDDTIDLAWGDVDGDGDLDLAAANRNGANKLYLNVNGELQTAASNLWVSNDVSDTSYMAWGDVDGDGDLDLAAANSDGNNRIYINGVQGGAKLTNEPVTIKMGVASGAAADFYALPEILDTPLISIPFTLFDAESDPVGRIGAEYSLNGGGQWFSAVPTQTQTTHLAASPWPTGTTHIFQWDTLASNFFGQSDNVVFRLIAYPLPAESAAAQTYQYLNTTPFPIQRPYASATTYPFRVRGTQVQVFSETISAETVLPNALVFRQSGRELGQLLGGEGGGEPFLTDLNGYLSGRGQLALGDYLFAAVPMTRTYRVPPQLLFEATSGSATAFLSSPLIGAVTAEFWLLPTADAGTLFTVGDLTLSNSANLQVNGQATGVQVNDGFAHHVALSWQSGTNRWNLFVDGEAMASGTAAVSLDNLFILGEGYQGSFDEIRLWSTVRTSQQISETRFISLAGNEAGLVGYWPVEADDTNEVYDATGHLSTLALSGEVRVDAKPLYTVYHTSGAPTSLGIEMAKVAEPGVQQLVVSKENPLMLFDLDVSLEWDASGDADYLERLEEDIKRASEVLYDLTNGQVAFGQINVYQDKDGWDQADIQIFANNNQRPNATLGGIVTDYLTDTLKTGEVIGNAFLPGKIRIGATWNRYGNPGGTVGEDWPRVLAHEFGHYGLFLLDNYLGVEEVNGNRIIVEIDCAGSAMTDAYRPDYSEFLSEMENANQHSWLSDDCQKTLAEDTTGRSDWETLHRFYPFLNENIFSTLVGPTILPLAVTQVAIHQPENDLELLTSPIFYINDTQGNLIPFTRGEGQTYLYQSQGTADPEDDEVLHLGSPSGPLINARGAAVGDRLCVFDSGHTPPRVGCVGELQNSNATVTLLETAGWQPEIVVRPVNSTTLVVTVTQPAVSNIHVQLFPSYRPTETVKSLTAELVDQGDGVYTGQFQFPLTVLDGFVRVWEEGVNEHEAVTRFANAPGWDGNRFIGFGGNRFVGFNGNRFVGFGGNRFVGFGSNTFVGFGGNRFIGFGSNTFVGFGSNTFVGFGGNTFIGFNAPLASPDGQVILYNVDNILAGNVAASLQSLPNMTQLPAWLTPVGQVYRYNTEESGSVENLVIQFQYLQRELPAIEEDQLRIYYLDEFDPNNEWLRLENTTIDDFRNLASAKMPGVGLYALIATVELPRFYEGWNNFGYLINENRAVQPALASIEGAYTSVYHYDAATKMWLLYDATIVDNNPEFATLVNDLEQLETGKGYWLYATENITAYLGVAGGNSSLDVINKQLPPATYYGYVQSHEGFQPTVGMPVTAWVNGVNCGQGTVEFLNGQLAYTIQVQSESTSSSCGTAGKSVAFQIGSWTMAQLPEWNNSQAQFLTLSTFFTTRPVYLPVISRP